MAGKAPRMEGIWKAYGIRMGCSRRCWRGRRRRRTIRRSRRRRRRAASRRRRISRRGRHASAGRPTACIETPDGYTTVGMGFCLDAGAAVLGRAAERGLCARCWSWRTAADAELKELGSAAPSPAAALRDDAAGLDRLSRRGVRATRRAPWGGGTGGGAGGRAVHDGADRAAGAGAGGPACGAAAGAVKRACARGASSPRRGSLHGELASAWRERAGMGERGIDIAGDRRSC